MPFGWNPNWLHFKCPICKQRMSFSQKDKWARDYAQEAIQKHINGHSETDPQQVLYGSKEQLYQGVKERMKIPTSVTESGATKSGLSFIKASQLEPPARPGETIEFTMNGDVETNGSQDASKTLYSVPVSANRNGQKLQGQYSLNRTSLKILVAKLGDETSQWTGAHFTAFIGPTRNPQTGAQTLSFSILADSVKSGKAR